MFKINQNTIKIIGKPKENDILEIANHYHKICTVQKYTDVTLNFSECDTAFESFMLPLISIVKLYKFKNNVDTEIIEPSDENKKLLSLFHNCNWSHLIDNNKPESNYQSDKNVPALQFRDDATRNEAVDKLIKAVLSSITLDRGALKALEWAANEITDNVLNHSKSDVGGFLQATTFETSVEFVVADCGMGIPKSLNIQDNKKALEEAVKEGVTSNKETNAGNGLFGSYQIAIISGGKFSIYSKHGSLVAEKQNVEYKTHKLLFPGTVVSVKIDCSHEKLLEKALKFAGESHEPGYDYIERKYENLDNDDSKFIIKNESNGFGSRQSGKPVKTKIANLLAANPHAKVTVDFNGVGIVSSSFADEVFGRLFTELGPMEFMSRIKFIGVDPTINGLIDRAIKQRMILSSMN